MTVAAPDKQNSFLSLQKFFGSEKETFNHTLIILEIINQMKFLV